MNKNKCSCIPNGQAIAFLVNNGIPFVYRRGNQRKRFMLYFLADEETAYELHTHSGVTVYDENTGWDFSSWKSIIN